MTSCMSNVNKTQNPYYFGMKTLISTKLKKTDQATIYNYSEENLKYFLNNGYVIKAKSAFTNTYVNLSWAELAAKQMGSDVILVKHNYVGTASGRKIIPWYVPGETYTIKSKTIGTINTTANSNTTVIGSSGYAIGQTSTSGQGTYDSNTTTTIQGPDKYQLYSVPYSYDYYDQYAVFLVKENDVIAIDENIEKKLYSSINPKNKSISIGKSFKTAQSIPINSHPALGEGKIIGYTNKKEKIIILEKSNDRFYKVEFRNEIGYVLASWIE